MMSTTHVLIVNSHFYLDQIILSHLIAHFDEYKEDNTFSENLNTLVKEKNEYKSGFRIRIISDKLMASS